MGRRSSSSKGGQAYGDGGTYFSDRLAYQFVHSFGRAYRFHRSLDLFLQAETTGKEAGSREGL